MKPTLKGAYKKDGEKLFTEHVVTGCNGFRFANFYFLIKEPISVVV